MELRLLRTRVLHKGTWFPPFLGTLLKIDRICMIRMMTDTSALRTQKHHLSFCKW